MKDRFAQYHPLVNFLYFTLVLVFSMVLRHPLAQGVSLLCACIYAVQAEGQRAVLFCLKWCLPVFLLTALFNPAFSHEGVTILLYLPTGNPLTLESILYGVSAGVLLVTVMVWFMNSSRVITSDKFIYLFGRVIPALSLVLSMTLRFIPKFKSQLAAVVEAQRSIGRDISQGSLLRRMKLAVSVLSIMITWALENAIETADSMKSRGYGLPGRSAYAIYRMSRRDAVLIVWILAASACIIAGAVSGGLSWKYFPLISRRTGGALTFGTLAMYLLLCATPLLLSLWEAVRWRASSSGM